MSDERVKVTFIVETKTSRVTATFPVVEGIDVETKFDRCVTPQGLLTRVSGVEINFKPLSDKDGVWQTVSTEEIE